MAANLCHHRWDTTRERHKQEWDHLVNKGKSNGHGDVRGSIKCIPMHAVVVFETTSLC